MEWVTSADEQKVLLNLTTVKGIGSARLRQLISRFGSPTAVCAASEKELVAVDGVDGRMASEIRSVRRSAFGEQQITRLFEHDFLLLTYWNSEYPSLLRQIADPPIALFVRGEIVAADCFAVAIVGTRMPTRYGRQVTEKLTAELVAEGTTVVSGLARGIDTIAHLETVKRGGRTIAVLGSGLDAIYPAENRKLAEAISENGAVLTELPFGTSPDAVNFPRRNRIISGMTLGTVVIEARERSGALITANQALEQNREVFAVPGSIFSPQSRGCHDLIREGAKIVSRAADILEELPQQTELFQKEEYLSRVPPGLSEQEEAIMKLLSHEPVHIDTIARTLHVVAQDLLTMLLQLEFKGFVRQLPGKYYCRA